MTALRIDELPEDVKSKLKKTNLGRHIRTFDADQARKLAARIMVVLTDGSDTKATQRKALTLVTRWLAVR